MRYLTIPVIIISLFTFSTCNTGASEEGTEEQAEEINDANLTDWAEEDAEFVVEAFSFNLMLIEYAEVAMSKESTPEPVKEYADNARSYYAGLNRDLIEVAEANNIVLPTGVGEDVIDFKENLMKQEGAEFAESYVDVVDDIHRRMINEYQEAIVQSVDEELKTWVSTTLPNIEAREEMVDELLNYADELD